MSLKSRNIKKEHIEQALAEIDANGFDEARQSSRWNLVHNGNVYPPKVVISLANKYANGEELSHKEFSGGPESNEFLEGLGFEVKSKGNGETVNLRELLLRVLAEYPRIFKEDRLVNNPERKELVEQLDRALQPFADKHGVEVNALPGSGKMTKEPYISFLYPGHKQSKGIGLSIEFLFNEQAIAVGFWDSDDNPPEDGLPQRIATTLRERLPSFEDANKDGYPRQHFSKDQIENTLVTAALETGLSVLREVLDENEEAVREFLARDDVAWSEDELRDSVKAYIEMRSLQEKGESFVKKQYYRDLAEKHGRSFKAFEYRMQNISHVYASLGRSFVKGLKPAKNVGANVAKQLQDLIEELEGKEFFEDVAFEEEVSKALKSKPKKKPEGSNKPSESTATVTVYERSPEVKAWVLLAAKGICELCVSPAPFRKHDGTDFLEVHHVKALGEGGSDTVENCVAICPNCHRELHHGVERDEKVEKLYAQVDRLVRE